jgi:exopolysaccharide production protein ExoZ
MTAPVQLKTLQQGRGLASIAVAAFHLSILLALPRYLDNPVFHDFTKRGNLGVDFFFVLSGFIIAFAHEKDVGHPERLGNYLSKRFIRLFPIYWVYTAIFCALVALGFGGNSIVPQTLSDWASTIFLVRFNSFELPITPGWTLMHELAFYVVFAVLIVNRLAGLVVFTAWMVIGGIVFQYAEEGTRQPLTTYFSPLNFNFLIGMCAYYAWSRINSHVVEKCFYAGAALFAVVYYLESNGLDYRYTQIPYAISFGLLVTGAAAYERSGFPAARLRLLNLIGDASYTIYLTHLAFLGLYCKIFIKILGHGGGATPYIIYAGVLFMSVASSCVLYLLVERPLLTACRKWLTSRDVSTALMNKA